MKHINHKLHGYSLTFQWKPVLQLLLVAVFLTGCGNKTLNTIPAQPVEESADSGPQFTRKIVELFRQDGGWVSSLPLSDERKPRVLTGEEKDRIVKIASTCPRVIETMRNQDIVGTETRLIWAGWTDSDGVAFLQYGAVENGTANLSSREGSWYPGVEFILTSRFGASGRAGVVVVVNLKDGTVVYKGAFDNSEIIPLRLPN